MTFILLSPDDLVGKRAEVYASAGSLEGTAKIVEVERIDDYDVLDGVNYEAYCLVIFEDDPDVRPYHRWINTEHLIEEKDGT